MKTLVVTGVVLLVLIIILPNVNAQENPAAEIIKKAQKNLQKFENRSTTIVQPFDQPKTYRFSNCKTQGRFR